MTIALVTFGFMLGALFERGRRDGWRALWIAEPLPAPDRARREGSLAIVMLAPPVVSVVLWDPQGQTLPLVAVALFAIKPLLSWWRVTHQHNHA